MPVAGLSSWPLSVNTRHRLTRSRAATESNDYVLLVRHWDVQVFFDSDCPLCMREIRLLRRLDSERRRIWFTDIAQPSFDARDWDTDKATLMGEIHGRLPDGNWITGVEVFRQLYSTVGFRRIVAVTRWPGIRHMLDVAYRVFARNRLRLTGRRCDEHCALPKSA